MPALPKNKWAKLPAAQRGNWSYQKYRTWVGQTEMKRQFRAKLAAQGNAYDPYFAATSSGSLQKQAHNIVTANTAPLIAALTKQIEAQRKAGSAEINANTGQLVKSWAPFASDLSNLYSGAITQQQGVDKNLADYVKGAGQQGAAALTGAGAQAGASPEAQAANAAMAQTGAGAAAATAGMGASTLSRLIADRAGNVSYAASLPGRAKDMGAWNLAALTRQLDQSLSSGTADIQGKVPGMVSDVMQQLMNRELEKATARQGFAMDTASAKAKAASVRPPGVSSTATGGGKYLRDSQGNIMYDAQGNPIPNIPKTTGPKGGMTENQRKTRYANTMKQAGVISANQYKQLQGKLYSTVGGYKQSNFDDPKKFKTVLEQGRKHVTTSVLDYLHQQYPGQSAGWYRSNAATALEGAGWNVPAKRLRQPGTVGGKAAVSQMYAAAQGIAQAGLGALTGRGRGRGGGAAPAARGPRPGAARPKGYISPAEQKLYNDVLRFAHTYRSGGIAAVHVVPTLTTYIMNHYKQAGLRSITRTQAAQMAHEAAIRAKLIGRMQ